MDLEAREYNDLICEYKGIYEDDSQRTQYPVYLLIEWDRVRLRLNPHAAFSGPQKRGFNVT